MDWRGKKCPQCDRKGLNYADHPHAFGHKDYSRVRCRWCKKMFDTDKLRKYFEKMEPPCQP